MVLAPNSVRWLTVATVIAVLGGLSGGCSPEAPSSSDRGKGRAKGSPVAASMAPVPGRRPRQPPRVRPRPRPKPHPACRFLTVAPGDDAPAQKIVDASQNLDAFFKGLLALVNRGSKRQKVRVAFYGDSNATMDWAAGHLRRYLGKRFGHGGHGFITAGKSVPWYQHREMRTWSSRGWKAYSVTNPRNRKRPFYGHAGHISYGIRMGAFAQFNSAKSGSPADEVFSTVQVHYLCWPLGGRFEVQVDKKVVRDVQTRCKIRTAKTVSLRVVPGRHEVRLKVRRTIVGVFGAAFENEKPGVVVDGLGVGALNVKTLQEIKSKLFAAGLVARQYDLVILHTGTNMWGPGFHPGWAREVINRIRAAMGPRASILVLSPPAFGKWKKGRIEGHKRMAACAREKRVIAANNKVAFWDYFRSMGGRASIPKWRRSDHIHGDLVHFKPPFHELMMKRLGRALMDRFRDYLRRKGIRCPAQTPGRDP